VGHITCLGSRNSQNSRENRRKIQEEGTGDDTFKLLGCENVGLHLFGIKFGEGLL
jgi:hypothetical protein